MTLFIDVDAGGCVEGAVGGGVWRVIKAWIKKMEPERSEIITKKICPILKATKGGIDDQECFGKRCAWWDTYYNCCAVLSSAILTEILVKKRKDRRLQIRTREEIDSP